MGRWPKISRIGAILTLVFGAFPATIFALLPVFGFVIGGIGGIVERDIGALAIAAWSALGLVGTYGLWRAVFGVIDRGTVVALSCGLVAFAIAILVWWPEFAVLAELRTTLREDLNSITIAYDTIHRVDEEIVSFVDHVESGNLTSTETSAGIKSIQRFITLNIRYGPYETLKARGIDLITNQSLRVNLTSLYEDEIPTLVEDSVIDRRLSRDRILPFILESFWLDALEDWIPKQTSGASLQSDLATLGRYRASTLTRHYLPSLHRRVQTKARPLPQSPCVVRDPVGFELD